MNEEKMNGKKTTSFSNFNLQVEQASSQNEDEDNHNKIVK